MRAEKQKRLFAALRMARMGLGSSQSATAKYMGAQQSEVSGIERGEKDSQLETIQRFARAIRPLRQSRRYAR